MSDPTAPGFSLADLATARVYDLSQPMHNGMVSSPNHPGFRMALWKRHGDSTRSDGTSSASEIIVTGSHIGTHIDAFSHFSDRGSLHGGADASTAQGAGTFSTGGVEEIPPLVRRGVLLDVAAAAGVEVMAPGAAVDAALIEKAISRAGTELRPGDVAVVRTGWSRYFAQGEKYLGGTDGVPGVTLDAAGLLADRGIVALGGDTASVELIQPGMGHSLLPVHRLLLVERGIFLVESLDLEEIAGDGVTEFLFVLAPLKLVGATGSPARPLGVIAR